MSKTWISLSRLLSPAAYLDLSTTCTCKSKAPHGSAPAVLLRGMVWQGSFPFGGGDHTPTLMATGSPVRLSLPFFTTAKPARSAVPSFGLLLPPITSEKGLQNASHRCEEEQAGGGCHSPPTPTVSPTS